ncbi:beta-xylosidase [Capsaspora owczarzaki ATCC 30864]|uniref:Beta-xylosidase n=1 Tax=Capsaspora owczarzaki (strain ATCC 30864) TaxID=595528 RepID=A0A0D2X3Q0_CAPO3|nr:beta-xylosidase [Capsaspora owczarzaki ATCC 30864]KJE94694.1 beta-xylosidase [Capsaspora owczarzaki ATCC 30864]|eukprot:XP_004346982.2 beta-xylosidase [Capsaspora owczarzaki ATCC 30864]
MNATPVNFFFSLSWMMMMQFGWTCITIAVAALVVAPTARALTCEDAALRNLPFCNPNLAWEQRADDLVGRLTLQEKISQFGTTAPGVARLGVNAYEWWSEALHGVAESPGVNFTGNTPVSTCFPQIIGVGATFNLDSVAAMAQVISTEARAFANAGHAGLTYFTPNINIFRDPRWGRGQETPGEDPYLTSRYVETLVQNLQNGEDARYLKVVATCKHYTAYDMEDWGGIDRFHFNAVVSDQDLVETFMPPFEACVRVGKGASLMCSYNAVNGIPSCADDFINNEIAREQWGFDGYIVSDCGAIDCIQYTHNYTNTTQATCAAGIQGGCDLDCGDFYQSHLMDAIGNATLHEADLDFSLRRLFGHRIRLGEFDAASIQPYRQIPVSAINSQEHQELALQIARESIVLLGNDNNTLPFSLATVRKLAIIGPNADDAETLLGNYYGDAPYLITPLKGFQQLDPTLSITFVKGCDVNSTDTSGFVAAAAAAKAADATIVVVGLNQTVESENLDRTTLVLPGVQAELILALTAAARGPVILVVMSGSPIDLSNVIHPVRAALWIGYPGQAGGRALAEAVFGVFSPAGRLPFTVYPADYVNQLPMTNMDMRAGPGRTYRFYTGTPLFEFGHGLSYSTFQYTWSNSSSSSSSSATSQHSLSTAALAAQHLAARAPVEAVSFRVLVQNTGKMASDDVVLAFASFNASSIIDQSSSQFASPPIRSLVGFRRIHLAPGASQEIFFAVTSSQLAQVDSTGAQTLVPSRLQVAFGSDARLVAEIQLVGEPVSLSAPLRR